MPIRINRTGKTSPSARSLATSLSATVPTKRLRTEGSTWKGKSTDLLINWGSTSLPSTNAFVLNPPEAVANSVDKLTTFSLLEEEAHIPQYRVPSSMSQLIIQCTNLSYAEGYDTLLFRTTSTGHGGKGIHVLDNISEKVALHADVSIETIDEADYSYYFQCLATTPEWQPIFQQTKFVSAYFDAKDEYRVHVFLDNAIHVQRKGLRTDDQRPANPSFYIRNHDNGFIFQINNITPPDVILEASIRAVKAIGLHFGAVDIRYNPTTQQYCLLEVNSAPALTGTTLDKYTEAFTNFHTALQDI